MNNHVSVIIVTHNREKLLPIAIESVLNQKFTHFEIIIIDDASTDNTEEIVKKYLEDSRVKYIKIEKANSISRARNSAWPYAKGKYVAILDSDDIWSDDLKLTKQYEFLENHPEVNLVGSGAVMIDDEGMELGKNIKPISDTEIRKDFLIKNPFFHSSVVYRFETIKQLGGYDESIKYGEDFDLWLRMGKIGKVYNFPDTFIKYRVHQDNESSKHAGWAIVDVFKVIGKNRKNYGVGWSIFIKKIIGKFLEFIKRVN